VPDRSFDRRINTILRDDLLAQLRAAGQPMSTSELRSNAPQLPLWPGATRRYPPAQERIYRVLCRLADAGKVIRHPSQGRTVTWSAAPSADDAEIDVLERAFNSLAAGEASAAAHPIVPHLR
jgi:hypothetical protein